MIIKKINWMALLPFISFLYLILNLIFKFENTFNEIGISVFLIIAIMSSVYYAEEIAHLIGDGLGSLLLALSVTVIEVGLILSLMSKGGPQAESVARDTVFASIMIVCNGIVGLCLFLGGLKNHEVGFKFRGTNILLIILIMLSVFTFILPNYTTTVDGPYYNHSQLMFVSVISLVMYLVLIWVQTKTHQNYFESENKLMINQEVKKQSLKNLFTLVGVVNVISLCVGLISVIGLAKFLAPQLESVMSYVGAPKVVVGLIIAAIVLLPEAITALIAAKQNNLQSSLNLALGSGAASIALTIPVIGTQSILENKNLLLGIDAKNSVFLFLTFIIGSLSLGNGKATAFHGLVHLIILISYFVITIVP